MRVVVTGPPGSGKSTLLQALRARGYATADDTARAIIKERRAQGLSPRPAPLEFAEEVLRRDIEQYNRAGARAVTFFERGVIDALGMVASASPSRTHELLQLASRYRYFSPAFVLPAWEAIYVNDDERDHPFAHAVKVHSAVIGWYQRCGYAVVEVPKVATDERCEFVCRILAEHKSDA
jgi:predicted ATPase